MIEMLVLDKNVDIGEKMLLDKYLYNVCVNWNRYIVPFEFKEGFDFDEVCQQVDNEKYADQSCWVRSKVSLENKGDGEDEDDDIFGYLMEEFSITDGDSNNKLGCHWRYQQQLSSDKGLFNIYYHDYGPNPVLKADICDMGLYVFRTGVGMLWYEIDLNSVDGTPINNSQLERFQDIFKELNDDLHIRKWVENRISWDNASNEVGNLLSSVAKAYGDNENIQRKEDERLPFSMGTWIAERLAFLQITYFSQRKNHYAKDLVAYYAQSRKGHVRNWHKSRDEEELHQKKLMEWKAEVNQILEASDFESKFPAVSPDKSLHFSYNFFVDNLKNKVDDEKIRIVFYLTNGFDRNVNVNEDIANKMKTPFSNVIWYATREGCGYYAFSNEKNKFFRNVAARRIRANYFVLYIRVLYQSYSLLHFTHRLASDKIPADYQHYISTEADPHIEKKLQVYLSSLRSMINVFLLKSTVTSVSHVQHHNEFYTYLEKQLFIEEDIASVSMGLDVLDDLVKEQLKQEEEKNEAQKQKTLQTILAAVTVMTLASTVSDSHAFIEALFVDKTIGFCEGILYTIISFAAIVALCWIFFPPKK